MKTLPTHIQVNKKQHGCHQQWTCNSEVTVLECSTVHSAVCILLMIRVEQEALRQILFTACNVQHASHDGMRLELASPPTAAESGGSHQSAAWLHVPLLPPCLPALPAPLTAPSQGRQLVLHDSNARCMVVRDQTNAFSLAGSR